MGKRSCGGGLMTLCTYGVVRRRCTRPERYSTVCSIPPRGRNAAPSKNQKESGLRRLPPTRQMLREVLAVRR